MRTNYGSSSLILNDMRVSLSGQVRYKLADVLLDENTIPEHPKKLPLGETNSNFCSVTKMGEALGIYVGNRLFYMHEDNFSRTCKKLQKEVVCTL